MLSLVLHAVLVAVFLAVVTVSIVYAQIAWLYIIDLAVFLAVFAILKVVKRRVQTVYTFASLTGVITQIRRDVKNVRGIKVGEIGPARPFDHDRRDVLVCELYIRAPGARVMCIVLEDVSPGHCEYYKVGDEVVRLPGTRFPWFLIGKPAPSVLSAVSSMLAGSRGAGDVACVPRNEECA